MSDRPKTPQPEKGQVTSLTQHRAERNGQFVPSIYDTPYRKGERINCDDPSIAYTVRVGRIRVQKEIDTRGGRRLVTVDFLDKDEPLLVNRFIASIKDDHDLQFYADTDVVIGEFPIPALGPLFGRPEFQAQFAAIAARHVQSSRKALYGQLVRYQEKLEELEEAKRLVESTQRKLDEIADENIGLQLKVLGTESENAELKKALASSLSKQETLRRSNQNLCASQQTMRDTHVEEIERIAKLSKERYAELRERRDRDKRRERLRWRAVENLLARLGNPLLLPDEIQDLLGVDAQTDSADLPDADVPTITIEEAEAGIDIEAILIAEEAEDAERSDTLIPPWDGSVTMSSLSAEQPPASCPRPAFLPAPRAPLPTLDLGATREDFVRDNAMPRVQPTPAGIRTAVMASIPLPTRQTLPQAEAESPDINQGRWSWPDDGPLFPPEEPKSAPVSCPTPGLNPDDDTLAATTETWDVSDPWKPKPKKR